LQPQLSARRANRAFANCTSLRRLPPASIWQP